MFHGRQSWLNTQPPVLLLRLIRGPRNDRLLTAMTCVNCLYHPGLLGVKLLKVLLGKD